MDRSLLAIAASSSIPNIRLYLPFTIPRFQIANTIRKMYLQIIVTLMIIGVQDTMNLEIADQSHCYQDAVLDQGLIIMRLSLCKQDM